MEYNLSFQCIFHVVYFMFICLSKGGFGNIVIARFQLVNSESSELYHVTAVPQIHFGVDSAAIETHNSKSEQLSVERH